MICIQFHLILSKTHFVLLWWAFDWLESIKYGAIFAYKNHSIAFTCFPIPYWMAKMANIYPYAVCPNQTIRLFFFRYLHYLFQWSPKFSNLTGNHNMTYNNSTQSTIYQLNYLNYQSALRSSLLHKCPKCTNGKMRLV